MKEKPKYVSHAAQVLFGESRKWSTNKLRFATDVEAGAYVIDLAMRWSSISSTRVIETADAVNARLDIAPNGVVVLMHVKET